MLSRCFVLKSILRTQTFIVLIYFINWKQSNNHLLTPNLYWKVNILIIFTFVTTRFPLIFDPNQPLSEWGSLTIHRWLIDIITNTKTSFIIFYELSLMKLKCNLKFIRDNLMLKYFFFKLIFFFKKLLLTYFKLNSYQGGRSIEKRSFKKKRPYFSNQVMKELLLGSFC